MPPTNASLDTASSVPSGDCSSTARPCTPLPSTLICLKSRYLIIDASESNIDSLGAEWDGDVAPLDATTRLAPPLSAECVEGAHGISLP